MGRGGGGACGIASGGASGVASGNIGGGRVLALLTLGGLVVFRSSPEKCELQKAAMSAIAASSAGRDS